MIETNEQLIDFEEFHKLVDRPLQSVRIALRALKLEPISLPMDRRQKRYRREWVKPVQEWIDSLAS